MKTFVMLTVLLASCILQAQCPTITLPSTLQLTTCVGGHTIAATANYTANIVSRWIGPGNIPITSSGGANSIVYLNYVATYTVEFTDTISHCVVTNSVNVNAKLPKPVFQLTSPQNFTLGCGTFSAAGVHIINASAADSNQVPNGGPVNFHFAPGSYTGNGSFLPVPGYTVSNCGPYHVIVRDNNTLCDASFNFTISCTKLSPLTTLSVSPNLTICPGSAALLTASGANSYSWSNGQTGPSITVTPSVATVYSVKGFALDNCYQTTTVSIGLHSTCVGVPEEKDGGENLTVFPNPAKNQITLQGISNRLTYTLNDLTGRIVLSGSAGEQDKIDVSMLPSGCYQLSLDAAGTRKCVKILIVN